jgi:hypothetical protein
VQFHLIEEEIKANIIASGRVSQISNKRQMTNKKEYKLVLWFLLLQSLSIPESPSTFYLILLIITFCDSIIAPYFMSSTMHCNSNVLSLPSGFSSDFLPPRS